MIFVVLATGVALATMIPLAALAQRRALRTRIRLLVGDASSSQERLLLKQDDSEKTQSLLSMIVPSFATIQLNESSTHRVSWGSLMTGFGGQTYSGVLHSWPIYLRVQTGSFGHLTTRYRGSTNWLVLDLRGHIPANYSFRLEIDEEDDRAMGDEALAFALWDGYTQRRLRDGDKIILSEGLLAVEYATQSGVSYDAPDPYVMIHLSKRLMKHSKGNKIDVFAVLQENLTSDRSAEVRAQSLEVIARYFPENLPWALEQGQYDVAPSVRFVAARRMGKQGLELVESLVWDDGPKNIRRRALRYLLYESSTERRNQILQKIISECIDPLLVVALQVVAESKIDEAIEWLKVLVKYTDIDVIISGCVTLGDIGLSTAEVTLCELMSHQSVPVRVAAAEALGRVGTLNSIPTLTTCIQKSGSPYLKHAADMAIQLIHIRYDGAGEGALSVAQDSKEGTLSLFDKSEE